ncbi:flagellar biosynthetic protein FliO [Spirochaetia bacterium 38H-sp]|uniref:Flagellar biosynthetic protein FliO n=1 Tax=Rarispira pelagica TaxID=3141764 RepID=A0ABU9UDA8_9SPIR
MFYSRFSVVLLSLYIGFCIFAQEPTTSNQPNIDNISTEEGYILPDIEQKTEEASTSTTESPSLVAFSIWDAMRMILVLAVVLGMIYALFFFLRKTSTKGFLENEIIKIIDTKVLASNKTLYVIKLEELFFLIGVSDSSISLISEISDKDTKDRLELISSTTVSQNKASFPDLLKRLLSRASTDKQADSKSVDFLEKQKERLKKL